MKFSDLLRMSINNLRRRKLRTGLTVLGVVIGTASIVVMVSLGIGLKEITVEQYESSGSLTKIQVYRNYGMGGSENEEDGFITDKTIESFKAIPHVKAVSPVLSTYVQMRQGAYEGSSRIEGLSREALEEIELGRDGFRIRPPAPWSWWWVPWSPRTSGRPKQEKASGRRESSRRWIFTESRFYHVPELRSRGKRQAEKICVSCQRTCKK